MSDFVNPTTLDLVASASDMPAPWVVCTRDQYTTWSAISRLYRKWVVDQIVEMTAAEKTAADTAARNAARDSAAAQLDRTEDVMRAFMLVVLDELNSHAAKMNGMMTAIDASSSIATLKSGIAAIPDYPTRTAQQLRDAVRTKLGN